MPLLRTPAQQRSMKLEEKENASPQFANRQQAIKVVEGKQVVANRFGFTPSPPSAASRTKLKSESGDVEPALCAKEIIKELAKEASELCMHTAPLPSAKQLLREFQQQTADTSASSDSTGGGHCGAFTVAWTPVKPAKKPVLAQKVAEKKHTLPTTTSAPKAPACPSRRSLEKVALAQKQKTVSKDSASAPLVDKKPASSKLHISKDAEKKAGGGGGGGKASRSSLAAPHLPAQKSKKEAAAKRKTFHDKWAEDESTKADGEGVVKASISERLQKIREEQGCSLGEARRRLWQEQWGGAEGAACSADADLMREERQLDLPPASDMTRSAPSSPSNARGRGREQVLREHLKDDSCVALSTPLKLKQAARATPGMELRFACGALCDLAEVASPRDDKLCSPMRTPSAAAGSSSTRGLTASPIGVTPADLQGTCEAYECEKESFHSASQSPVGAACPAGSTRDASCVRSTSETATSPMLPGGFSERKATPERLEEIVKKVVKQVHLEEKEKLATTLTHTSLQAAQVAKPVEAEKVGEEESAGVRLELEAVSRERDLLCLERTELLFHRNQLLQNYHDTCQELLVCSAQVESVKGELSAQQLHCHNLANESTSFSSAFHTASEALHGKEEECNHLVAELAAAHDKLRAVQGELEAAEASIKNFEARCMAIEEALATLDRNKTAVEERCQQVEERYHCSVAQLAEADKSLWKEVAARRQLEESYNRTLQDFQEQLLRSEERDADLTALSNARQALEERVRALEGEARAKDAEAAQLAERMALQTERAALDMREQELAAAALAKDAEAISERVRALEAEVGARNDAEAELRAQLQASAAGAAEEGSAKKLLEQMLAAAEDEVQQVSCKIVEAEVERQSMEGRVASLTANLRSMTDELEGYKRQQEEAGEREAASSAACEALESKLRLMQQELFASNDTHDALSSRLAAAEEALAEQEAVVSRALREKEEALLKKYALQARAEEAEARALSETESLTVQLRCAQEALEAAREQEAEEAVAATAVLKQQLVAAREQEEALKQQLRCTQEVLEAAREEEEEAAAGKVALEQARAEEADAVRVRALAETQSLMVELRFAQESLQTAREQEAEAVAATAVLQQQLVAAREQEEALKQQLRCTQELLEAAREQEEEAAAAAVTLEQARAEEADAERAQTVAEIESLTVELRCAEEALQAAREQAEEAVAATAVLKQQLVAATEQEEALKQQLRCTQEVLEAAREQEEEAAAEKAALEQRLRCVQDAVERSHADALDARYKRETERSAERAAGEIELKEECEALKQQLRCARDEAAMLEQRLQDAAESERDALEREVSRCRVLVEREAGEVELKEECEALKQQLCSRTAQLKDECDALNEQLKCARDEAARSLASSTDVEEALQEAYTEARALAQKVEECEEASGLLGMQLSATRRDLTAAREALRKAESDLLDMRGELEQAQAESTSKSSANIQLAFDLREKELLLANLEGELKKKGTDVIYQEVVKEVEVERIVTEIEYRDVEIEVIKEVEKIVKEIEYRDVEVIKQVERIVTEIEYRDVEIEVIKEVEKIVKEIEYRDVEVIKEVEKIVTEIEYRDVEIEVIKEVEVEKIVTEIEYRDVEIEVIKEVEVEKIVKEIEYRDVEVIKEVEKIVKEIEYRDVEVEKIVTEIQYREVRVEVIKEVAAKEREPKVPASPEVCQGSLQQELCEGELVLPLLQPQLRAKPARASRSNEKRGASPGLAATRSGRTRMSAAKTPNSRALVSTSAVVSAIVFGVLAGLLSSIPLQGPARGTCALRDVWRGPLLAEELSVADALSKSLASTSGALAALIRDAAAAETSVLLALAETSAALAATMSVAARRGAAAAAAAAPPYLPRYAENLAAVSENLAKSSQNAPRARSKSPEHSLAPLQHTQSAESGNKEGGAKGSRRQESAKAFRAFGAYAASVFQQHSDFSESDFSSTHV